MGKDEMSGETANEESGWTVDTLRVHAQSSMEAVRREVMRELDSRSHNLDHRFQDLRTLLDERYNTQTKAVDAAFAAQQIAMHAAFAAADKAVQAALLAAEKAVDKAEKASNARFESVNEFRGQLADQTNTFMPRVEADGRINGLAEKVEVESKRFLEMMNRVERTLTSRLDLIQGQGSGADSQRVDSRQQTTLAVGILSLIIVFVSTGLAILVAIR